jgi:tetratricopeptide (TPR) repeat protein
MTRVAAALAACLVPAFAALAAEPAVVAADESKAADPAEAGFEAEQRKSLFEVRSLIDAKRLDDALAQLDEVIARYRARYPEGATRWYVARDSSESLAYLVKAATDLDKDAPGAGNARTLYVSWGDALYMKGYVLFEQQRLDEARAALDQALRLAPFHAAYLNEAAEIAKAKRDWAEALRLFTEAEDVATFSAGNADADRAKALRGQAFAHVELGALDAAEKALAKCLQIDANDKRAQDELEYIAQLRAQQPKD